MALDQAERKAAPDNRTGAESLLLGLKSAGIDFIFANAGTDFPPIIEAFAALDENAVPVPVTVPHETASVAMAHGYYLLTGRAQATMVHVNVGLANSAMGAINAASDNIPVLIMSGRTPITEHGRRGARVSPIQYGQEMYDQSSLVSDVVKFHYEMRYPEQGGLLAARAAVLATSEPKGPVYVSLPREALMDIVPASNADAPCLQAPATVPYPDPAAIAQAAQWLSAAKNPLIVCQRGDPDGRVGAALADLAETFAIPVVEPFSIRNLMASDHPMFLGYDIKMPLAAADVVLVVDSGVPWIESLHRPASETKIIHLGPDPNFQRMPVRGYQADLAIASDASAGLTALATAMEPTTSMVEERRARYARLSRERLEKAAENAAEGCASPMSTEWMSHCVAAVMDERAVIFSELGVLPGHLRVNGPNRIFSNPHSGGLGWALPAALGAQLADRERLVIASMGDGSYMFANPIACHQIAEALELPVLTIVKNNSMWNAVRRSVINSYPGGAAAKSNRMPLTSLEPSPDYTQAAAASRAYTERVEHGEELPAALARAVEVIRKERRQVLLELKVAASDKH
ncbi:thiamine pyrophosphate-requiring protein [Chelativorans salis]|uniref:Thiamine pyrophosphate-requiring protein n=1 Tax=Chelativorans salis TaxID=2978478 RepID=A0ABT2LX37_9HYPH|nr:thiamine pyrophosphate-requiring protein [Chelativorans sp. EGI FJ00035]MCT7378432.1 thiamine pyrophosphate-requiring protein [Chelativorans sp. EGI FJ00035]